MEGYCWENQDSTRVVAQKKKKTKNTYQAVIRNILGHCNADSKSLHCKMHSFMQELPQHNIHFAKQTVHLKWQDPTD
jgi:hypothetical protein